MEVREQRAWAGDGTTLPPRPSSSGREDTEMCGRTGRHPSVSACRKPGAGGRRTRGRLADRGSSVRSQPLKAGTVPGRKGLLVRRSVRSSPSWLRKRIARAIDSGGVVQETEPAVHGHQLWFGCLRATSRFGLSRLLTTRSGLTPDRALELALPDCVASVGRPRLASSPGRIRCART